MSPESDKCLCPGDVVTYECTVIGGLSTIWKGNAFDDRCVSEIVLIHQRYTSPGAYISCSNETIVARGLPVEVNETYTSQLSVTLTTDLLGKSIECHHENGTLSSVTKVASTGISPGTAITLWKKGVFIGLC